MFLSVLVLHGIGAPALRFTHFFLALHYTLQSDPLLLYNQHWKRHILRCIFEGFDATVEMLVNLRIFERFRRS